MARKRFVILDRDGTVMAEKNYLSSPAGVELLPGAAGALRQLREAGLGLVVITNQSGIGRGYFTREQADAVHARLADLLRESGVELDAVYLCPHAPEETCDCRKPAPALLLQAARECGFDPAESFVVGDKASDIELGRRYGARSILVETGYGREQLARGAARPDIVVKDLAEAARVIRVILEQKAMSKQEGLVPGAEERLRSHLLGSIATKQRLLEENEPQILAAAALMTETIAKGGKLLLCGNGGSAADCQHIAGELVSVLTQTFPRPGLPAIAMTTDTSILTASANDFGYEGIFERQTQALGRPGDLVLGISTSGNSENVVRAVCYARRNGMRSVALCGLSGRLADLVDVAIRVPSDCVQHIQEAHMTIGHILCDLVERTLFREA